MLERIRDNAPFVPADHSIAALRAELGTLAHDMMLDIALGDRT
ncbi:MAG TPA: hypothetical protein VIO33_13240 [Burkholderiaceae bacterium]